MELHFKVYDWWQLKTSSMLLKQILGFYVEFLYPDKVESSHH